MKQQTCKFISEDGIPCLSPYHTKMYHNPKKPIKRTAIQKKRLLDFVNDPNTIEHAAKRSMEKRNSVIKKARKKSSPRALAKKKAWEAFSLFIRTRDCLRFTGDPKKGMCVTCKVEKPKTELQAGHFVGGRSNAVLFNEQIVYSQCGYCNQKPPTGLGGNYAQYTLFMFDEGYTRKEIEEFLALKGKTKQYKLNDFIEIEQEYKDKLANLS